MARKIKLTFYQLHVGFHHVQYWDHFCSDFVNDLPNASKILDPVMFADDINLFFLNFNIPALFATVNSELSKISQRLLANKFSLNVTKAKYTFFHKTSKRDDISIKLPRLQINNYNIERIPSIKFLGVLLESFMERPY